MTLKLPFVCLALLSGSLSAQEMLRTYDLSTQGATTVTTALSVHHTKDYLYTPLARISEASIKAIEVSQHRTLAVRPVGNQLAIALPSEGEPKAECRLEISESLAPQGKTLRLELPQGRYVFILPEGYSLSHSSLPSQITSKDNRIRVGVVQWSAEPTTFNLEMVASAAAINANFEANFLPEDDRAISYQLLDPKDHTIRLWLELYVTRAGQSHFFSQLRTADNVTNPVTLDMDRGVELPTRIISGSAANVLGDAPAPFPSDAQVLVADLGYKLPEGSSARIRSYQTATDAPNYRLLSDSEFRLDRFIARTRTQYILPPGWTISLMDQPGIVSHLPDGRVTVNFETAASGSKLTIIGHRSTPNH